MSLDQLVDNWPGIKAPARHQIIETLIRNGRFQIIERMLALDSLAPGWRREHQNFYLGVLRKNEGHPEEAVKIFRALLAAHPGMTRVRLELAHSLFLIKEDESARHHFDLVRGSSANPRLEKTVQRFIDAMNKRRKWHVSAYGSAAPSSNLNQGSDVKTVYVNGLPFHTSKAARRKSGLGVLGGISGGYRFALTDRLDLVTGGGINAKQYAGDDYDDLVLSLNLGPRYRFNRGDIALYATASKRWYAGQPFNDSRGARLATSWRLGHADIMFNNVSCAFKKHVKSDLMDGHDCSLSTTLKHYFSAHTALDLTIAGFWSRPKSRLQRNRAWKVGLGIYREFPLGLTVKAGGSYMKRNYEEDYALLSTPRIDQRLDLTLNLTKRDFDIMGFAPMLQYNYTRNNSNAELERFTGHSANLTFTKQF